MSVTPYASAIIKHFPPRVHTEIGLANTDTPGRRVPRIWPRVAKGGAELSWGPMRLKGAQVERGPYDAQVGARTHFSRRGGAERWESFHFCL